MAAAVKQTALATWPLSLLQLVLLLATGVPHALAASTLERSGERSSRSSRDAFRLAVEPGGDFVPQRHAAAHEPQSHLAPPAAAEVAVTPRLSRRNGPRIEPGMKAKQAISDSVLSNKTAGLQVLLRSEHNKSASPIINVPLRCGELIFAPADPCPFVCPYAAEDPSFVCHFRCLSAEQCGTLDPMASIADEEDHVCRRCVVPGCHECLPGGVDKCVTCAPGYWLDQDGHCMGLVDRVAMVAVAMLGIALLAVCAYLVELSTRKVTNKAGLEHGLAFRERTLIHSPEDSQLYPLDTNLMRLPVAGPGTCLHFNFQAAVLIWAALIAYGFGLFATACGTDLLLLGLTPARTPAQLCSVIHWGADAQQQLLWAKAFFVFVAYLGTFVGTIVFAVYQNKEFHRLDDAITCKDYVAICSNLPRTKGTDPMESQLAQFLEGATGQTVVGASVCWDYTAKASQVMKAVEDDWAQLDLPRPAEEDEAVPSPGVVRSFFRSGDRVFGLGSTSRRSSSQQATPRRQSGQGLPPPAPEAVRLLLRSLYCSDTAFVVFETEKARNEAVRTAARSRGDFVFNGKTLKLETKDVEPGSCSFLGLGRGTRGGDTGRARKIAVGCLVTLAALVLWSCCFYLPFAIYMASFSYARGGEPSVLGRIVFTLLVLLGNRLFYFLADDIARRAQFGFNEEREIAHGLIYFVACFANLVINLVITVYLAYKYMVAMGVHTSDDRLLENVDGFRAIFESYPVQKAFGKLLFAYCFPSCFLLPFVAELVFLLLVPYHIARKLVGSHPELQGHAAEQRLRHCLPMSFSRYTDVSLNMVFACCVFLAPSGYTLPVFATLVGCHAFVYIYDHWRVLRFTPRFCSATATVDFVAQLQLVVPTACLAATALLWASRYHHGARLTVSAPQLPDHISGEYQETWKDWWSSVDRLANQDFWLYVGIALLVILHSVVHVVLLVFVVPQFAPTPHEASDVPYEELAKTSPVTFFTANPVHCLRSKYFYGYEPPLVHCIYGKEHLQRANPEAMAKVSADTGHSS